MYSKKSFAAYGVRGGEGGSAVTEFSAAAEVANAASRSGMTAVEYAANQASIERQGADERLAARAAAAAGTVAVAETLPMAA